MFKRASPPQFTREDPWADDDLNRAQLGLSIIEFVKTLEQPFAISLQSPWGGGKSTFVERIRLALLDPEHKMVCAKFDAWANEQTNR